MPRYFGRDWEVHDTDDEWDDSDDGSGSGYEDDYYDGLAERQEQAMEDLLWEEIDHNDDPDAWIWNYRPAEDDEDPEDWNGGLSDEEIDRLMEECELETGGGHRFGDKPPGESGSHAEDKFEESKMTDGVERRPNYARPTDRQAAPNYRRPDPPPSLPSADSG